MRLVEDNHKELPLRQYVVQYFYGAYKNASRVVFLSYTARMLARAFTRIPKVLLLPIYDFSFLSTARLLYNQPYVVLVYDVYNV